MYGSIRPTRPCASCTVATPYSPSFFTSSGSGRSIFRTILGFMEIPLELFFERKCLVRVFRRAELQLGHSRRFLVGFSPRSPTTLPHERIGIRDRHAPNLVDPESRIEHLLREHRKSFGDGRIDGLPKVRGHHAALRTHRAN